MKTAYLALAVLLGMIDPPPAIAADRSALDLQCAMAIQQASTQVGEPEKSQLQAALTFYFGRIDAQIPENELEAQLLAATSALQGKALGPILQQCGAYMEQRGKAWMNLGQRMLAKEKAGKPD